jgi:hypothetical protein
MNIEVFSTKGNSEHQRNADIKSLLFGAKQIRARFRLQSSAGRQSLAAISLDPIWS